MEESKIRILSEIFGTKDLIKINAHFEQLIADYNIIKGKVNPTKCIYNPHIFNIKYMRVVNKMMEILIANGLHN